MSDTVLLVLAVGGVIVVGLAVYLGRRLRIHTRSIDVEVPGTGQSISASDDASISGVSQQVAGGSPDQTIQATGRARVRDAHQEAGSVRAPKRKR